LIKTKKTSIESIFKSDILEKLQVSQKSGLSYKTRSFMFIFSFIFMIVALARPIVNNGEIKIKQSFINMVVGIDISRSMFCDDIYPSRFEFAKKKFIDMLPFLKNIKVALMGFGEETFLVSPLTQDFYSLKFLAQNLNLTAVNLKGTDILNALESANELLANQDKKILLLFSDGSHRKDFAKELKFAKDNHITIYIYGIGTKKGGVIPTQNGALKDKDNNIVVVKLNENIKQLALKSGGAYMKQTLQKDDIKVLIEQIHKKFHSKDNGTKTIKDKQELFYIPLFVSLVFLFVGFFSLPRRVR